MRRLRPALLLVAAASALAACGGKRPAGDAHAGVACVGCHRGVAADSGRGPVPDAACTASGCHPRGGHDSVTVRTVTIRHRAHGAAGQPVPCAACHTHPAGAVRIGTDTTACAVCHVKDLAESGGRQPACRACHGHPQLTAHTNQAVAIEHAQIDEAKVPCTRCHYQIVEGDAAKAGGCRACHADTTQLVPQAPDALHAGHRGYTCRTCHSPVRHRVVAMSSAVDLNCLDCHRRGHKRPNHPADLVPSARCEGCHIDVHAPEQRLVLGLLPGEPIRPSPMFLGGVTCRSCHVTPGQAAPRAGKPLRANEAACVGCHGVQWRGVLPRWQRGYARRAEWVAGYLAAAARAVGDSARAPGARAELQQARSLMAFLRAAGPLHNLPASDRLMRHALDLASRAYRTAGVAAPPQPELGPPVQAGSCMSCHYGIEEVGTVRDSASGRGLSHADHLFKAFLSCDACHAVGAAPPGLPDSLWIDTARMDRGGPARRRRPLANTP